VTGGERVDHEGGHSECSLTLADAATPVNPPTGWRP
jgi:hypothetical protein